ncbi:MAG: exodeoxyribonuclease-3 [Kiritimatiellia bacterium]
MRVTTWNVNSLRVRLEQVVTWSEQAMPDVLCLQETKVTDDKFPTAALEAAGFVHQAFWGQKTYNGVAILSRYPLTDVKIGFQSSEADPQARLIRATVQGVRIYCCYVPNGSKPGSIKFRYKLAWLRKLRKELDGEGGADQQILVCGDFNIAPTDEDVWDPFEAIDEILFHPLEHKTLKHVTSYGLTDALRVVHPIGQHFSWWDFRGGGFQRNRGYRIDHHWVTDSVAKRIVAVETHRDVRGWERPSDHVPVVAVLD